MIRSWQRLFVFGLAAIAGALYAQSDDWYQNHDLKNRWEGIFGEDQGSPEWELRSFVGSVESYPLARDNNVDLKVTYYVPDSTKSFIKATTINHRPSYLMEPKQTALKENTGWRYFEGWSTGDVLVPKKIPSSTLGVLIRLGGDSEAVHLLAPAFVYFSSKPKQPSTYRLDLYTATAIEDSSFIVAGQKNYSRKYTLPGAGARSVLPIEFDAREIPDGLTRVIVNLAYADSTTRAPDWKFYSKRLP